MTEPFEGFLHGTPAGWEHGCRGAGCANHGTELDTCARAWTRYAGDYTFRKRIDAGWTPEQIHDADVAESEAAVLADRSARVAERAAGNAASKPPVAERAPKAPSGRVARQPKVVEPAPKVVVEPIREIRPVEHGTESMYWLGCRGDGCPSSPSCVGVYRAHVEDGTAIQLDPQPLRRSPRELQGHGTNAAFARGCRCAECVEAHRSWHREYARARRESRGVGRRFGTIMHGTPTGYQLGCHDRETCPGDADGLTCPDASLAEERRRRREKGSPERALVDAKPVLEHVGYLKENGLGLDGIVRRSGFSRTAISTLIYGRADRAERFPKRVTAELAAAVLAIRPTVAQEHE